MVGDKQIQGCLTASARVAERAAQLRRLTQLEVQPQWRAYSGVLPQEEALQSAAWSQWQPITVNDRRHIAWPQGQQTLWLGQRITVPDALDDYPLNGLVLRLALTWWAELAEIFVEGQLVQMGDLFDCSARVVLCESVTPGETIAVAIRLVSPGHDAGALVRSHLIFEPSQSERPDPGMVADELTVLQGYLAQFQPQQLPKLAAVVDALDWTRRADATQFEAELATLRQQLTPWLPWLQQRQIAWVGHAHLDLAWLWPVSETWAAAERTFCSVLTLQSEFPELVFTHSSPALYAWLEHHRPNLFAQIQTQVAAGRWEVGAGLWVEPELNLVSGESLVRQVLYGQRYTQSRFGRISAVAWLPDSFGFCWQLPQILQQGGIAYFLTQKLRWNDTTEFPHEVFWWQAPDGSRLLSLMLPPIGEGIDPVKMADHAQTWEAATGLPLSLWLPGVGDHGGGPTRDMLSMAQRWQQSAVFPHLQAMTSEQFCRQVQAQLSPEAIPVWDDELYLEFHRGCYTSHADQKWFNRRCEHLLVEAEFYSTWASWVAKAPYPQAELEQAWKQVLFNQFHDILPGSAIPEVFVDANRDWQAALQTAQSLRQRAWGAIAATLDLPPPPQPNSHPVVVFNALNWDRQEGVTVPLPPGQDKTPWQIWDLNGQPVPSQRLREAPQLRFEADAPGLGYRVYWLAPTSPAAAAPQTPPEHWVLENQHLRVEICPQTGDILQVRDRTQQRDILSAPGNHLQFFQDQGQYWDAWNIDPDYASHPLADARLASIQWIDWGPVQQRLRVVRLFGQSRLTQDYVLEAHSPLLHIHTIIHWQERHVLVKAAFPLTVSAPMATYEIPCGAIARPTLPSPDPLPPQQTAKWEVPALHWADLTEESKSYGVSLLNDCKYGYDAQPAQLRLTLLRGSTWPDPECDLGLHHFTYALYPHAGPWQTAHTVPWGYALNRPLEPWMAINSPTPHSSDPAPTQPPVGQCFRISGGILMACKQAEDNTQSWIVRIHECHGETSPLTLESSFPMANWEVVDGLEQPLDLAMPSCLEPWKILSLRLTPS
ncbi:alpha-mannosidase [Synechococcales cyanobacterium C]|uniref:Alpha-mannosidase n=1 Tax=Petrachloros mirabilis ULC683 TaxID=2781853 RepID=A0A8K1ZZ91_9CYAN|nr:alpha-mannosidase [Petrachloros mirabilis]NCJ06427.1 alpha-mannosidase [Petrachloros mirabilis ULC683]